MTVARKMKSDVGYPTVALDNTKDRASLTFYQGFPLKGCTVGETVTLTIKGKVTSLNADKYSSGVGLDVTSVEKYK